MTWDVFHADRLEVERGLSAVAVRAALAAGALRDDDLARPAGSGAPWARLADLPDLLSEETPAAEPPPATDPGATADHPGHDGGDSVFNLGQLLEDDDDDHEYGPGAGSFYAPGAAAEPPLSFAAEPIGPTVGDFEIAASILEAPAAFDPAAIVDAPIGDALFDEEDDDLDEPDDPLDQDDDAAEFTLARGASERVEELDLAAMVDVAFQLVLFFLVTATTILYKTLEVPRPSPDAPPGGVAQGQGRSLDDLERDYILVEIDPQGAIKVDREPCPPGALIDRLRQARRDTLRSAMLLSADFATPHRNAVLAYDAANEIGLRIAIAKPGGGPPPAAGGDR